MNKLQIQVMAAILRHSSAHCSQALAHSLQRFISCLAHSSAHESQTSAHKPQMTLACSLSRAIAAAASTQNWLQSMSSAIHLAIILTPALVSKRPRSGCKPWRRCCMLLYKRCIFVCAYGFSLSSERGKNASCRSKSTRYIEIFVLITSSCLSGMYSETCRWTPGFCCLIETLHDSLAGVDSVSPV